MTFLYQQSCRHCCVYLLCLVLLLQALFKSSPSEDDQCSLESVSEVMTQREGSSTHFDSLNV